MHRVLAVAAVLAYGAILAPSTCALTVDTASVSINPKKSDAFTVKGGAIGLVPAEIEEVRLELGDFAQTIPIASFLEKNGKLSFKAAKGAPGLATLTLDTVKGKFAASAKGLTLSPFSNPAPFHLVAGGFDECSTISFTEGKNKFKRASVVNACGFAGRPRLEPSGIVTNTPTDVRVRVTVFDDLALDLSSLVVLRLDDKLQPIGNAVCTLHDDGAGAHGDDTAADGVFSCRATFTESQPARIRLAVQALRDTVLVLSPSVFLHVVPPLTTDDAQTIIDTQQAARDIFGDAVDVLGEGPKARKQAVAGILGLPGVANAGATKDGAAIFIQYDSGVEGGLDLDPTNLELPGAPLAASSVRMSSAAVVASSAATVPAPVEPPHVGNEKVLIWSPFYGFDKDELLTELTDETEKLFNGAACPFFKVKVLKSEQCTLASIETFPDYGTIIIITHGAQPHGDGDIALMSGEKATEHSQLVTYAAELEMIPHQLLIYSGRRDEAKQGYFVAYPAFFEKSFAKSGKKFPNTLVFNLGCTGAANKTLATTFLAHGAAAYLGMTHTTHGRFDKYVTPLFFRNMFFFVDSAAAALARIPNKTPGAFFRNILQLDVKLVPALTQDTLKSELTLVNGSDGRLTYPCPPPPPGLIDVVAVDVHPGTHAVSSVVLPGNARFRMEVTGSMIRQAGSDFSEFDALYCFSASGPGACSPPFPVSEQLQFATQFADETPDILTLKDAAEFTHSPFPSYNGGHKYTFHLNGTGGKLWVAAWPFLTPGQGESFGGSFTVKLFRE